ADEYHQGGDKERHDSPNWIFYVNNDPLIAPPAHPVICLALARSTQLLLSHTGDRRDIQSTKSGARAYFADSGARRPCRREHAIPRSSIIGGQLLGTSVIGGQLLDAHGAPTCGPI